MGTVYGGKMSIFMWLKLKCFFCFCADIVFLRSWYPVSVPQLYNPVTSLLLPPTQKDSWSGMRTLGQLKNDLGIQNKPKPDSLYKVEPTQPETSLNTP